MGQAVGVAVAGQIANIDRKALVKRRYGMKMASLRAGALSAIVAALSKINDHDLLSRGRGVMLFQKID